MVFEGETDSDVGGQVAGRGGTFVTAVDWGEPVFRINAHFSEQPIAKLAPNRIGAAVIDLRILLAIAMAPFLGTWFENVNGCFITSGLLESIQIAVGGQFELKKKAKWVGIHKSERYNLVMNALICLITATIPLACAFLYGQLNDENYQFSLPYLVSLVWIGWQRFKECSFRASPLNVLDVCLIILVWVICAGATVLNYPRGAFLGLLISVFMVGRLLLENGSLLRMLPVLMAGILVIPPPLGLLDSLTAGLQSMVVSVCHHVLVSIGLLHRVTGNVILLADRPLLVAEACSGVRSLVSIVGLSICYCLFQERSWQRSVVMFFISIFVVTLLNIFRILFIVFMIYYQGLDFTMGLKHEILGFAMFASGLVVILGTDQLFEGLRDWLAKPRKVAFTDDDPQSQIDDEEEANSAHNLPKPNRIIPPLGVYAILIPILFVPIGLFETKLLITESLVYFSGTSGEIGHLPLQNKLFQKELDGWKIISGPEIVEDATLLGQGVQSQFWIFEKGGLRARLAVDEPFHGFHNLAFCYRNVGWQQNSENGVNSKSGSFRKEVTYFKPPNKRLFLLFGHVDENGSWILPENAIAKYWDSIKLRISSTIFRLGSDRLSGNNYQIQLSCQSNHELSNQQRTDLTDLFEAAREAIANWPEIVRSK